MNSIYRQVLALTLLATMPLSAMAAGTFPVITAKTLNNQPVSLPSATTTHTAVIVAFSPRHQGTITPWLDALAKVKSTNNSFNYYEVPTMANQHAASRKVIEAFMKKTVPNANTQAHVVPYFTNIPVFQKTLGITSPDQVHVYLLDKNRQMIWQSNGAYTPAKLSALQAKL